MNWKVELNKIINTPWIAPDPFRKISSRGIALYGAGSMGKMAMDLLNKMDIVPSYIIDKNYYGELYNIKVIKPEEIPQEDLKILTFIICIAAVPVNTIFNYLKNLGCIDVRHLYDFSEISFPELMSNGWAVPNPDLTQIDSIKSVCKSLEHDECSLAHYFQFLWWRLRRMEVVYKNYPVISGKKFFNLPNLPLLTNNESFVDGGAHDGSTLLSFIYKVNERFNHVWAFEPDLTNLEYIKKNIPSHLHEKITIYEEALFNKCKEVKFNDGLGFASKINIRGRQSINAVSLDSLSEINPSIIKFHIEGGELNALMGSENTIKKNRPIIIVLADHNIDGLFKIPLFLMQFENYKLFFYLHDYCGNSAVFYAYPMERL